MKRNIGLVVFVLTLGFSGFTQAVEDSLFDKRLHQLLKFTVPIITVEEANKEKKKYVFLDARELEEYNLSKIPGAHFVGYRNFNSTAVDIDKSEDIIVYCSVGYRSEKIGEQLIAAGFENVHNLYGSIFEWVNRDYTIVDKSGKPTKKLHTYNKRWSKWVYNKGIQKIW